MITIPVYDLLILPGVTFYFKKDAAEKWDMKPEKEGDEVLFLFEKEEKPIPELAAEDFYPYGVLGEIDQLDSDGTVRVRAKERVAVSDFEQQDGSVFASAVQAPEADDLPEWAFFNVGTLEDARQKAAEKLAEEKGGAV